MSLTRRQVATAVLRGEYDRCGLEPPALHPSAYKRIVRAAEREYDADPTDEPERIVRAEKFRLAWVPMPGKCGAHLGDLILAPYLTDPRVRAWILQHERAHGWTRRLKRGDANEADMHLLTAAFVARALEHYGYERSPAFPWAPEWFVLLVLGVNPA